MGWIKLAMGAAWLAWVVVPTGCGGDHASAETGNTAGAATSNGESTGAAGGPANVFVDGLRAREGCLPRSLPVAATASDELEAGQVRCAVAFVTFPDQGCACAATQNLKPASVTFAEAISSNLTNSGLCDGTTSIDCGRMCACELLQSSGAALTQYQTDATPIDQLPPGFCYVDALAVPPLGDPALVATCPADSRRGLRILGPAPVAPAPWMYVGCW
jgi:hypothetical protein